MPELNLLLERDDARLNQNEDVMGNLFLSRHLQVPQILC